MHKLLTLIAIGAVSCAVHSQSGSVIECATEIDASNSEYLKALNKKWLAASPTQKAYGTTTEFVPVQLHIIRENAGTGGISSNDALAALDRMNEFYINASMHF